MVTLDENLTRYYHPEGSPPTSHLILSYVSIGIIGYILSIVYIAFSLSIPIIYLHVFLPIIVGIILLFCVNGIGKIFRFRKKIEYKRLAIFSSLITLYFSWIIMFACTIEGRPGLTDFGLQLKFILSPLECLSFVATIFKVGFWNIMGGRLVGVTLLLVWLVEAFCIFIIPYINIHKKDFSPYSNSLKKWFKKYDLKDYFEYSVTKKKHIEAFEEDYMNAIKNLEKGFASRYGKLSIYYLKNASDAYLSFTNISVEQKGQGKTNENTVFHLLRIDPEDAEVLMKKHGINKTFFFDH